MVDTILSVGFGLVTLVLVVAIVFLGIGGLRRG